MKNIKHDNILKINAPQFSVARFLHTTCENMNFIMLENSFILVVGNFAGHNLCHSSNNCWVVLGRKIVLWVSGRMWLINFEIILVEIGGLILKFRKILEEYLKNFVGFFSPLLEFF